MVVELTISSLPSSSKELVSSYILSALYSVATAVNRLDTSSTAAAVSVQESFSRSSLRVISRSSNRIFRRRLLQEESLDR